MRKKVLQRDVRGIVASVLQLLGTFEPLTILELEEGQQLTSFQTESLRSPPPFENEVG